MLRSSLADRDIPKSGAAAPVNGKVARLPPDWPAQRLRMRLFRSLLIGLLGLAGCAGPIVQTGSIDRTAAALETEKQNKLVLQGRLAYYKRLYQIAHPILKANADVCETNQIADLKALVVDAHQMSKGYETAAASLGIQKANQVVLTIASRGKDWPIQEGDLISSINETPIPLNKRSDEKLHGALLEAAKKDVMNVAVFRNGQEQKLVVPVEKMCGDRVGLWYDDAVNAYADGKNIFFTTGMMRFATTDKDVQLVFGHELAHNIMDHIGKKKQNAWLGMIVDVLVSAATGVNTQGAFSNAAANANSPAFEAESDYVGVYLLERAGIDTEGAADFWRKMAAEHPGSIRTNHAATHPPSPERFLMIEKTTAEIAEKRAKGEPLKPNLKQRLIQEPTKPSSDAAF
jgi:Zn-dependent protease with chaperone function